MLLFWNVSPSYLPMSKKFILPVNIQSRKLSSCLRYIRVHLCFQATRKLAVLAAAGCCARAARARQGGGGRAAAAPAQLLPGGAEQNPQGFLPGILPDRFPRASLSVRFGSVLSEEPDVIPPG